MKSLDVERAAELIRRWGYLKADLDPLGEVPPSPHRDLDEALQLESPKIDELVEIYCGKVGAEFMHMPYPDRCDWVAEKMENFAPTFSEEQVLRRLVSAERLESFIHTKYVGSKWFSAEGITSLIPLLDTIIERAAEFEMESVVIGMAHRGRISVLYHIMGIPASTIFAGFEDIDPKSFLGGGDAKYHRGATGTYRSAAGHEVKLHLASNPSHLESVNPVVMGRTKAKQRRLGDETGGKVLAVLIHGDAAFAGQGITAESLNFAELEGFNIGGTIHIVANNLFGFTARPAALHSSKFATEIAKRVAIPIFHVNCESITDVIKIGQLSMDYRKEFRSDVVIDLIGYRRFGHNEMDDPTTTSPVVYDKIKTHPLLFNQYANEIGIAEDKVKAMEAEVMTHLKSEQERVQSMQKQPPYAEFPEYWDRFVGGLYKPEYEVPTAITAEQLERVARALAKAPQGFNVHPKIQKNMELRLEMGLGNRPIDWGTAEMFAFGSLLEQGVPVRIVGQDARRATFNQRQSALYDIKTGDVAFPLKALEQNGSFFEIYDSCLSELAALGFEYGFTRDFPEALVCWEAQFGDFVNGAQIIIDQYVSAGEDKWGLLSGLVMLLPHGYEGMGPEHSSARIERFLQACGEDNIQVVYPSNAAQHFHLMRRQVLRIWRKPLIVFSPKSILRLGAAAASVADLTTGSFKEVLDDDPSYRGAERLILCSGKLVHELRAERKKTGDTAAAIVTIEQLYPFPEAQLEALLAEYTNVRTVVWAQEEPANMGALFFVKPLLDQIARGRRCVSVKRSSSASPATGSAKAHQIEQEALIKAAFRC
jgi:2-oxoglutarate dehydrogenase E1 component